MRSKKNSMSLTVVLAIFGVTQLVTGAPASAQPKKVLYFGGSGEVRPLALLSTAQASEGVIAAHAIKGSRLAQCSD